MQENDERSSLTKAAGECDPRADKRPRIDTVRLLDFRQDEQGDWVAVLSCGHTQHLRHSPPWQNRPWVLDSAQRQTRLGNFFPCGWCAQAQSNEAI
nr:DUF3565 domain-containing protein [Pseudomonas sp. NCCP-436]